MLRTSTCLFLLLTTASTALGQRPATSPDVNLVLEHVNKHFAPKADEGVYYFQLEKRQSDWYLAPAVPDGSRIAINDKAERPVWTAASGKYQPIPEWTKTEASDESPAAVDKASLAPSDWFMYRKSPFYGYSGWSEDVINLLAPKTAELNDTMLYVLGRAYVSLAMEYCLHNSAGLAPAPVVRRSDSLQRRKGFFQNESAAIACFRKLKDRNPGFPTSVGSIQSKWANETVGAWLLAKVYWKDDKLAASFLVLDCYAPDLAAYYRYLLQSCAPKALLFVYGDLDTYCCHYLQEQEGLRRDVRIVNISLLGLPGAYPAFLLRPLYGGDALGGQLSPKVGLDAGHQYLQLQRDEGNAEVLSSLLSKFMETHEGEWQPPFNRRWRMKTGGKWIESTFPRQVAYLNELRFADFCESNKTVEIAAPDGSNAPVFGEYFFPEGFASRLLARPDTSVILERCAAALAASLSFPTISRRPESYFVRSGLVQALSNYLVYGGNDRNLVKRVLKGHFSDGYTPKPYGEEVLLVATLQQHGFGNAAKQLANAIRATIEKQRAGHNINPLEVPDAEEAETTHQQELDGMEEALRVAGF